MFDNFFERFYRLFIAEKGYSLMLDGLGFTAIIAAGGLVIGILLGTLAAIAKVMPRHRLPAKILNAVATVYITVIRGTPVMVQLLLMYYGIMAPLRIDATIVAILVFGMNSGAYVAEIIRSGVQAVDYGQMEAARSLGMTYWRSMFKVVLPQAIRTMIPSIINQFIITLKDTSILSVIGFPELVNKAKNVVSNTGKSFQTWAIVAFMYLVVITLLSVLAKQLERRLNRGRKH